MLFIMSWTLAIWVLMSLTVVPNWLRICPPPPGRQTAAIEVMLLGRLRVAVVSKIRIKDTEEGSRAIQGWTYH